MAVHRWKSKRSKHLKHLAPGQKWWSWAVGGRKRAMSHALAVAMVEEHGFDYPDYDDHMAMGWPDSAPAIIFANRMAAMENKKWVVQHEIVWCGTLDYDEKHRWVARPHDQYIDIHKLRRLNANAI